MISSVPLSSPSRSPATYELTDLPLRNVSARERNFLSWIKLTLYLIAIFAALLLRFQLGQTANVPRFQLNAETPVSTLSNHRNEGGAELIIRTKLSQLGILFFVASLGTVSIGTSSYFGVTKSYFQKKGFAYAGRVGDALMIAIGLLTISTCILLLVAN